jgi:Leucine-rich repeat (LRR) protein
MKLEQLQEAKEKKAGDVVINGKILGDYSKWDEDLDLNQSQLTSLEGCPKEIDGSFFCAKNKLTSLEGGPEKINGYFSCSGNKLTSLKGCVEIAPDCFNGSDNKITSIEHCPKKVKKDLDLSNNKIKDLHNIHKYLLSCECLYITSNPIKSHVLGLLKINGLNYVNMDNEEVEDIIHKYLPLGDIIACQDELMAAGLEAFAQL